MKLRLIFTVLLLVGTVGCSSTKSPPTQTPEESDNQESHPFTKDEFMGVISAFIASVGQDAKAHGYTVIFADLGPDSWEKNYPNLFQELVQKSSGGGVQVRGYSRMQEDGKVFRDKLTGERGVRFTPGHFTKEAPDKFSVTGEWDETRDKGHFVRHKVIRDGAKWEVL